MVKRYRNAATVARTIVWCKRTGHFTKLQQTHALGAQCERITTTIQPSAFLTIDDTANNGLTIQAAVTAAGLVEV